MLEILPTPAEGFALVTLRGDINSASAPQVEQAITAALAGQNPPRCVLDLSGLTYTSSAGLRVFLACAKRIKTAGGTFVLCAVQPAVYDVLDVSGFTRILTLAPDLAAARLLFPS
ncbi:MAG: STAS domain-containing protein [Opitutaceae bacterium]|nr:STAS domain-containing protein [Opitutaceae bacterium]